MEGLRENKSGAVEGNPRAQAIIWVSKAPLPQQDVVNIAAWHANK